MGIMNDHVRFLSGAEIGRIQRLGQIDKPFPVLETVGGIAGTGLLVGGVVIGKTPGTVMGILGGITLLGSLVAIVVKLASSGAPAGAPAPSLPAAPPPPPPPPPSAQKVPSYQKYADYATAFAPVVNQLFTKLFGAQPAMMVAHGRGR